MWARSSDEIIYRLFKDLIWVGMYLADRKLMTNIGEVLLR